MSYIFVLKLRHLQVNYNYVLIVMFIFILGVFQELRVKRLKLTELVEKNRTRRVLELQAMYIKHHFQRQIN